MNNMDKTARLNDTLPNSVLEKSIGFHPSDNQNSFDINAFLKQRLPVTDHIHIKDQLVKGFSLSARRKKIEKNVCKKKSHLSLKDKRKLGLYNISKTGLVFNDFLSLHNLWVQYMEESLNFRVFDNSSTPIDVSNKHWEAFSTQLTKTDYHGAYVRVSRSKCPSQVGIEGIVVMDTKYTFKILGKDNVTRTVPKESSIFKLTIGKYQFTVYGKHFCARPSERSTKKIKLYLLPDLWSCIIKSVGFGRIDTEGLRKRFW